ARSDALCRAALAAYAALFRRSCALEPDAGLAQSYASGRRAIDARAQVQPWTLPAAAIEEADVLLRLMQHIPDEHVDEWIELFPRAFLEAIDRRHLSDEQLSPLGRRFVDRFLRVQVRPLPG
ncbi:MAG TPA: hypothetical protein VLS28_03800, partial [Candidatus Sulfomarinibacteraceae bacterium]|nr:hypothetical protein [Candidatus Sulfomarinibacteraceae bacterium]